VIAATINAIRINLTTRRLVLVARRPPRSPQYVSASATGSASSHSG
jgi:ATP-dependent helicase YprA (DUF1998 family)